MRVKRAATFGAAAATIFLVYACGDASMTEPTTSEQGEATPTPTTSRTEVTPTGAKPAETDAIAAARDQLLSEGFNAVDLPQAKVQVSLMQGPNGEVAVIPDASSQMPVLIFDGDLVVRQLAFETPSFVGKTSEDLKTMLSTESGSKEAGLAPTSTSENPNLRESTISCSYTCCVPVAYNDCVAPYTYCNGVWSGAWAILCLIAPNPLCTICPAIKASCISEAAFICINQDLCFGEAPQCVTSSGCDVRGPDGKVNPECAGGCGDCGGCGGGCGDCGGCGDGDRGDTEQRQGGAKRGGHARATLRH
jgi:hypothetical protein